jgi:fructose transport system ATP-binding protein
MPHVFEIADRIHIQRLGRRATVITPQSHTMSEAVAIMTGAAEPPPVACGDGRHILVGPGTLRT